MPPASASDREGSGSKPGFSEAPPRPSEPSSTSVARAGGVQVPCGSEAPVSAASGSDLGDLVRRARLGDRQAQEEIIRAFESRVLRLAHQMMGNRADAEDVAQEAFLQLFRRLDRLDSERDPTGWVVRVTIHMCWDHLGRRRRRAEDPLAETVQASDATGPAARARQAEQREILRRSLQILAPRERAVFILHEVDGEEVAAIARTLRIHRITVRRHLSQARQRLRAHLAERYPQLL